jgi:hypothetical protein
LQFAGLRNAHRIDLLPKYVHLRIQTDVARDVHMPQAAQPRQPGPVDQVFNWIFFGGELLIVVALFAGAGVTCASRAYCEACGKWMERETLKLPPGQASALWSALQSGNRAEVQRVLSNTSRKDAMSGTATVEYCAKCPAEGLPPEVFFTVKDIPLPGARVPLTTRAGWLFKPRFAAKLQNVVNHVALEPEEVVAIAPVLPKLKAFVATQPEVFVDLPVAELDEGEDKSQAKSWEGRLATVKAVEPADAGRVLTRTNAILQTLIGVVTIFGGLGLAFLPPVIVNNVFAKPPDWLMGIAVCTMMGLMLLNLLWLLLGFPNYVTMRFMRRQTHRAFDGRLNPALDLHDPELVFVDIVPPVNRGKQMMENASDIGFLKIDTSRRELIFEGDCERYWIPVESILETNHEYWADSVKHQLQSKPNLNHVIRVRAMTANGPWETWFYRRATAFRPRTAKRRLNDALELQSKIDGLRKA